MNEYAIKLIKKLLDIDEDVDEEILKRNTCLEIIAVRKHESVKNY